MKSTPESLERSLWQVPDMRVDEISPAKHRYVLVVPVINEGERLHNLLGRIAKECISEYADVLIVDGGSSDGSVDVGVLRSYGVNFLITKLGPGKLSAQLRCAYAFALDKGYAGVVTIDGNDKDDPVSVKSFIEKLIEGYDFVQGSRFINGGESINAPLARILGIRLVHAPLLSMSSRFRWTDTTQGFRGYSERLLRSKDLGLFRDIFSSYELLPYLNVAGPRTGFRCLEVGTRRIYPAGKIPTKINGFQGNLELLKILVLAVTGAYSPKKRREDSAPED